MRIFAIVILLFLVSIIDLNSQDVQTEPLPENEYIGNGAWQSRVITRRGTNVNRIITGRREIDSELTLRKQANRSLRDAREALARKRFIRKEKSKKKDESCQKAYNAYVQNDCIAYNSKDNPTESFQLWRNELVVLKKQKKDYYELCIIGESFFVFRESE